MASAAAVWQVLLEDVACAAEAVTSGRYRDFAERAMHLEAESAGWAALGAQLAAAPEARERSQELRRRLATFSELLHHLGAVRDALERLDPDFGGGYGSDGGYNGGGRGRLNREA